MATVYLPFVQIKQFETSTLFPLNQVSPGKYVIPLMIEGNSILSSLLVTEVERGASITVNYYQTTTGDDESERTPLTSHQPKTLGSDEAETITVSKVHFKPVVEVIIENGNVTFGLMATMVSSFTSDLEQSLFADGYRLNGLERGIPLLSVDEATGQMKFVRSKGGYLIPTDSQGTQLHLNHTDNLDPDSHKLVYRRQQLKKSLRISQFTVLSDSDYRVTLRINGSLSLSARVNKYQSTCDQHIDPFRIVPQNSLVTVDAQRYGDEGTGVIDIYLRGYEFFNLEEEEMASLTKVVYNATGSLILPFKAVAWEDNNSVALADADGIGVDDFAGITQDGIANLGYGIIHKLGEVPDALIGMGAVAGQPVYLSTVPGELTLVAPTSGTIFRVGRAEPPSGAHSGEATSLFIDPQLIAEG